MKSNVMLLGVAGIILSGAALAKNEQPALEMMADGEVQIAPDGSVSDYRLKSQLAPTVASLVDKRVRTWHFVPVLLDGKPVLAKTAMHLRLSAIPLGDDKYRLEVANVTFGEPKHQPGFVPPHYPPAAVHARVGAKVLLYAKIDDTGKVTDVQPYQTSLDARANSEVEAGIYRKLFETASIRAVEHWQFDLSESIDGKKVGTVVLIPFDYFLRNAGAQIMRDGEWKAYVPGPIHDVPWAPATHVSDATFADLGDGEARSLDSHFKLRDDVIGKTL